MSIEKYAFFIFFVIIERQIQRGDDMKLLLLFAVIIGLLVMRKPLAPVLGAGALVLGLLYKRGLMMTLLDMARGVLNATTLHLIAMLTIIMLLEYVLRTEDHLDKMLKGLQALVPKPRFLMALLPAFIGLMPSVGGAIFSAPLVEQVAKPLAATAEDKATLNYYYRHVSEFLLPIYPNILLVASITGFSVNSILRLMAPMGVLFAFLGVFYVRRIPPMAHPPHQTTHKKAMLKSLLIGIWPILVIVFSVLFLNIPVLLAVLVVMVILFFQHHYTWEKYQDLFKAGLKIDIILMVASVMAFKGVLESSGAIEEIPQLLAHLPIAPWLLFAVVFMLLGFLTGYPPAFIGIGYPIATAVMGSLDPLTATLFFISGLCGQMMTPLHLCMTLTTTYFNADLITVMRRAMVLEVIMLAVLWTGYALWPL